MAIKLKKWKNIISFTAFFAGVSLLLNGTLGVAKVCGDSRNYSKSNIKSIVSGDYQETGRFQNHMEERLEEFLTISVGGRLWYSYYEGDYWLKAGYWDEESYWYDVEDYADAVSVNIAEATWLEQGNEGNTEYGGMGQSDGNEADDAERNEQDAKKLHEAIKEDKNLLYRISADGRELYSNMEDYPDFAGDAAALPEGYNFFLHFDGSEVKIYKDGRELDVYGDGYYREDGDWYVPGYKNFKTADGWKDVDIWILAAKEPVTYSYGSADGSGYGGYRYGENELYYIFREAVWEKRKLQSSAVFLLAGIILLIISCFFRKEKRAADEQLAVFTGKIWVEAKLLVLAALIGQLMYLSDIYYGSGLLWETYYEYSYYDWDVAAESAAIIQEIIPMALDALFTGIAANPFFMTILFWVIYLLVNDIKKNKGVFRHGLIAGISRSLRTKNLKLPLARQVVRRFLPVMAVSAGVCMIAVIVICAVSGKLYHPVPVILGMLLWLIAMAAVCFWYLAKTKKLAVELELLGERITAVHDGNYSGGGVLPEQADLGKMAAEIDDIRQGLETAIDERLKSERMKVELVANVSHDIKTPLTSIISYVEFLKQEEDLPLHVKDYIKVLDEKSQRLKNMIQDVFSISKAASGQLDVTLEELDFCKLLRQTLADMDARIKSSAVTVKAEIPDTAVMITADGQRMYRVFQNLIVNALNYSLEGSRVYVTLKEDGTAAAASITNTSRQEIAADLDFTERFTRGDESRTDGGSGLGLSIAKSFTEACGGNFSLETIADLFVVTVSFEKK